MSANLHRSVLLSPFIDDEPRLGATEQPGQEHPCDAGQSWEPNSQDRRLPSQGSMSNGVRSTEGVKTSNQGEQVIQAKGWVG